MTIEHCQNDQHSGDLQVQIHYGKRRFCHARGRDLSSGGISLDVRHLTLPIGTVIDLEFREPGNNRLIEAIVTHQDHAGIKVSFLDCRSGFSAMLDRIALPPPRTCSAIPEYACGR